MSSTPDDSGSPLVHVGDIVGLYEPVTAAAASRGTTCSISDNTHDVPDD